MSNLSPQVKNSSPSVSTAAGSACRQAGEQRQPRDGDVRWLEERGWLPGRGPPWTGVRSRLLAGSSGLPCPGLVSAGVRLPSEGASAPPSEAAGFLPYRANLPAPHCWGYSGWEGLAELSSPGETRLQHWQPKRSALREKGRESSSCSRASKSTLACGWENRSRRK